MSFFPNTEEARMDLEPPRNAMHTRVQLLRLTRFKHAPDIHLDSRLRGTAGQETSAGADSIGPESDRM